MRQYLRVSLVLIFFMVLGIYHNCSKVQFSEKIDLDSIDGRTGELPDYAFAHELICGGARVQGKYHHVSPNECTIPETSDQSCDRWGCAIVVNDNGDSDCPSETDRVPINQGSTQYFLCLRKVITDGPVSSVCGGARSSGKLEKSPVECTNPHTTDNSCNRWGCAIRLNRAGTSSCPEGTQIVRISDAPTYILCLEPE